MKNCKIGMSAFQKTHNAKLRRNSNNASENRNISGSVFLRIGIYLTFLSFILSSCATLTKSQLAEVNAFGQLTKNFSSYPSKVYIAYHEIHQKALVYAAIQASDPENHYKLLLAAYDLKIRQAKIDPKLDLSFKIIDKYAQGLVALSADKHVAQLDTAAQQLGSNLDQLIKQYNGLAGGNALPTGIGAAVSNLISIAGNQYIKSKQADEIKSFVNQADPMIGKLTTDLKNALQGNFIYSGGRTNFPEIIKVERQEVKQDYKAYLTQFGNQHPVALASDLDCLQMIKDLDNLYTLYQQTLDGIDKLKNAHHQLMLDIQQKATLKSIVQEIQDYGDQINKLKTTLKAIKS